MITDKKITKSLLLQLRKAGLSIMVVSDGVDNYPFKNTDEAADDLTATGMGHIGVTDDEGNTASLVLVYGNEPFELVADYACSDNAIEIRVEIALNIFTGIWENATC